MSARSDALAAQLAVLRSKAERREAIARFEDGQMSTDDARALQVFRSWLASPGAGSIRAAAEGSPTAGGNLTPLALNAAPIRPAKEDSGLLNAFSLWESEHRQTAARPAGLVLA